MPRTPLVHTMGALALTLGGAGSPAVGQTVSKLSFDTQLVGSPNPFLLPGPDRSALMVQISAKPELKLSEQTGSQLDLAGTVAQKWYSQHYGNYLVGDFTAAGTYRDSEHLSVDASAGFSHDLVVDELTTSIDGAVDPQSVRTAYSGRLLIKWHPNAHVQIQPELSYENSSYQNSALLRDTRIIGLALSASKQISPFMEIGVRGRALFSKAENTPKANSQAVYATLKWDMAEHWKLSGQLGAERTSDHIEQLPGQTVNQPARTALSGRGELCRETAHGTGCLTVEATNGISGIGGLERTISALASVTQKISSRASVMGTAEYRRSTTQGNAYPSLGAFRATAKLERQIGHNLACSALFQYQRRQLTDGHWVSAPFGGLQLRFQPRLYD